MGFWLFLAIVVLIVIYISGKNNKNSIDNTTESTQQDLRWHNYILSFKDVVRTKAEKNLINALLSRKTADQLYENQASKQKSTDATQAQIAEPVETIQQPIKVDETPIKPPTKPLDNTILLLYFGAFLLVASAGLFVAIGNFSGGLRTVLLAITAATLYIGGLWIYKTKKKLTQAGISFMGVGMIIAPLVGVAWYNLVADQTNGAIIWLVTSLVCIALYAHAYSVIKNGFMAYLLIGSFVSSVESTILAIEMPVYVFAWGAIFIGLALQILRIVRSKQSKPLLDASDISAQVLVPLSLLSSLIMLPNYGNAQLAITLILTSGYYGLLAWQRPEQKSEYATGAQVSFIAAIANLAYLVNESFSDVALVLGGVSVIYICFIIFSKLEKISMYNFVLMGAIASAGSIVLSVQEPWELVSYTIVGLILSASVWLKLHSTSGLAVSGLLLLTLPYMIGQYAMDPGASALMQLIFFAIATANLAIIAGYSSWNKNLGEYYETASYLFIGGSLITVIAGWYAEFTSLLITCLLLAIIFVALRYTSKESGWWAFSGVYVLIPVLYAFITYGISDSLFSLAVALALVTNIAISLVTRETWIRALVVFCILIAPLAVGGGGLGFEWQEAGYSAGYLIAMAGCVLARAIARGKLFVSSKVNVASYEKNASQAYVAGYIISAILAVAISLFDDNSQLVTTVVLGILSAALIYIVYFVESNNKALLLLPLLLQGMLFSGLRPDLSDITESGLTAILSALLGAIIYAFIYFMAKMPDEIQKPLLTVSVASSYLGPAIVLIGAEVSELMPISLAIAGAVTVFHNLRAAQMIRELSIGVLIIAVHWFLYLYGVENIHIHTHILALFLGGFAFWRFSMNDKNGGNNYVIALFVVATLPLILQALIGENGADYGILLIVQQIGFLLLGVVFNLRFLIKASLWVALGAVLYQLRGLGWAFLAIIALILIGVAVYRLQKHSEN